jgi:hypothetical protein
VRDLQGWDQTALQLGALRDALLDAGVSPEKAAKVAEEAACA